MASIEGFKQAFPEFADTTNYPDARVQFWMELAQDMLIKKKWGKMYDKGIYLYVAHCLTLEKNVMQSLAGTGGGSGGSVGAVSSESETIGDTSYSTSYSTSAYTDEGQMASTVYGQMYIDLRRVIGAGVWQL